MPATRGARPDRSAPRRLRLSRLLARVLRHKPEDVGLTLDAEGFTSLEALARALAAQPGWETLTAADLAAVAAADPRRYELRDGRIRARYGHTVPVEAPGEPAVPPEWLYYGVPQDDLPVIRTEGLRPGTRRYVHLATTPSEAAAVARRHADAIVAVAGGHTTGAGPGPLPRVRRVPAPARRPARGRARAAGEGLHGPDRRLLQGPRRPPIPGNVLH